MRSYKTTLEYKVLKSIPNLATVPFRRPLQIVILYEVLAGIF